ncbi:MAG: MerR family transcriptional regulator [Tomitella sp.]|nr:MerR family transcriptional regulator [Tomitella sp.]
MSDYRIDDLAQEAGVSVRNVRVYQERGLLPPPRREGRAAWYGEGHLARLRLISRMLERGYTFATIDELLTAAQEGLRVQELIDPLPSAAPQGELASSDRVSLADLRGIFGESPSDATIRRTALLGALADPGEADPDEAEPAQVSSADANERSGDTDAGGSAGDSTAGAADETFEVVHPQLLEAAAELSEVGVPLEHLLALAESVQDDMRDIARRFVGIVADHYLGEPGGDRRIDLADDEITRIAELINRLRPRANQVLQVLLAQSMDVEIGRALERAAEQMGADPAYGRIPPGE